MGDATVKPSSGDDLVLENTSTSAKIEINDGGVIGITPGTSLNITLGSDGGDDLNVDTDKLVVEGDTGRTGIGTASPSYRLDVETDIDNEWISTFRHTKDDGSGCHGLNVDIAEDNNASNYIFLARHNNGNTTAFAIKGNGNVEVSNGDLVIGTAGKGIDFSGVQTSASDAGTGTTTGEVLDSFEEGSWTPTWQISGGVVTAGAGNSGYYQKIGARVYIVAFISFGSESSAPAGSAVLQVAGLPFTSVASGFGASGTQAGAVSTACNYLWASNAPRMGRIANSADEISLQYFSASGNAVGVTYDDMSQNNTFSQVVFFGHYIIS